MKPVLTAAQMRWADRRTIEAGTPGFELMRRAGNALARRALDVMPEAGRILVLAGAGNNAGDGYAAAAELARRTPVTVLALRPVESLPEDAARHAGLADRAGAKIRSLAEGDLERLTHWLSRSVLVLDCLLGTGVSRPVAGWWAEVIRTVNASGRAVLACDIPSGISADDGSVLGEAVCADWTLPMAADKWGVWLNEGLEHAGVVFEPAGIGIPEQTLIEAQRAEPGPCATAHRMPWEALGGWFPPPLPRAHKRRLGHVWVFGGSMGFTGAPRLAAEGALAAGAGLASIACPREVYPIVAGACLEVMVHPDDATEAQGADAIVAGPGWGGGREKLLARLLARELPLVLDADALNTLAGDPELARQVSGRESPTVLTPHPGEAGRLLGEPASSIDRNRVRAAVELAGRYGCIVVLKGAPTIVADPGGRALLCPFGNANLAVAGTGDVLAGCIAARLARLPNEDPSLVAASAVALHGKAGEDSRWYRAGELPARVAELRKRLERAGL